MGLWEGVAVGREMGRRGEGLWGCGRWREDGEGSWGGGKEDGGGSGEGVGD